MLDRCHQRAVHILAQNRMVLEEMAAELIETEVLSGPGMDGFLDRVAEADDLADPPTAERLTLHE